MIGLILMLFWEIWLLLLLLLSRFHTSIWKYWLTNVSGKLTDARVDIIRYFASLNLFELELFFAPSYKGFPNPFSFEKFRYFIEKFRYLFDLFWYSIWFSYKKHNIHLKHQSTRNLLTLADTCLCPFFMQNKKQHLQL